jgi:hypothetical protein
MKFNSIFLLLLAMIFNASDSNAEIYQLQCFTGKKEVNAKDLQKFFDQGNKDHYPTYDLSGKTIVLDEVVRIYKSHDRTVRVLGNNALIRCEGGWIETGDTQGMIVSTGRGAKDIMSNFDTYRIQDIHFKGKNAELALRIVGTYQSELNRCTFNGFSTAVDVVFCMQMLIEHCEFKLCTYGLVVRSGMGLPEKNELHPTWFENASVFNSSSNRTQIKDCRFFGKQESHTLLRIDASDGVNVENCIFEGFNPVYAIYMDHRNSPTVPSFYIKRPHLEFVTLPGKETKALIHATAGGFVHIEGFYSQYGECTQIEASALQVIIDQPAYLPVKPNAGLKLLGDSKRWKIIDPWNDHTVFFNEEVWHGDIPQQLIVEQHNNLFTHGVGYTIHELKGGSKISQGQGRVKIQAEDMIFIDADAIYLEEEMLTPQPDGSNSIKIFDEKARGFKQLKIK